MHWEDETQKGYFVIPSVKEIVIIGIALIVLSVFWIVLWNDTEKVEAAERPISGFSKLMDDYYKSGGGQNTKEELTLLSEVMMLENGDASDKVVLLTGSVVINRMNHKWFPNTMHDVVYQGYKSKGAQQYATATIERLGKVKVTLRVRQLAGFLLTFGSIAPMNVIYQSMNPKLGSSIYYQEGGEYFGWE